MYRCGVYRLSMTYPNSSGKDERVVDRSCSSSSSPTLYIIRTTGHSPDTDTT